jgi:amino acid permease
VTLSIFALVSLWVVFLGEAPVLFSLVGSTVAPALDYILPSVLFIQCGAAKEYGERWRPIFIAGVGALLMTLSTGMWVHERFQETVSVAVPPTQGE